jgi:type I restriction enzyme, S subunit
MKTSKSVNGSVRNWKQYLAYKELGLFTGVQIPSHWSIIRLKHIAAVRPSNVDKKTVEGQESVRLCNYVNVYKNEYITEGFDFMQASATATQVAAFTLKAGDVIVTKDSETWMDIAVPAHVTADLPGVLCGYHLALVRPRAERITSEYLFRSFAASGVLDQFRVAANGITRFGLGTSAISDSVFPLPPVEEQRNITAFLKKKTAKIDTLIAKKERLIELLQEKRTALISHAVTKGLDTSVPMQDSGVAWLGKIPAHWGVIQSRRVFKVRNETATESDEQLTASQKHGMLPQTEFMELEGRRVVVTIKGIDCLRHVEPNDFVISLRSFQGGIEWCKLRGSVTFHYVVLKPVKALHPAYFGYLFKSSVFIQALRATTDFIRDGQDLRYSQFVLVPLPIVPLDEQAAIANYLDRETARLDSLITSIQQAIDRLCEYRTALISAAVTGQIDVREEVD